jgi:hypothetical protein
VIDEPITWRIDRPVELLTQLNRIDWGRLYTSGHVMALVCPMCLATIPAAFTDRPPAATTPRAMHTDWHVVTAKLLEDLERPPASFRRAPLKAW